MLIIHSWEGQVKRVSALSAILNMVYAIERKPGGASKIGGMAIDCETIRKGVHEVESGLICLDNFSARGRKRAEEHFPDLLRDITSIVDSQSQADPQFRTKRLYTRLDAAEVREQLMSQKGYTDAELPTVRTITTKLNDLGYYPQKVAKSEPKKSFRKRMPSSSK